MFLILPRARAIAAGHLRRSRAAATLGSIRSARDPAPGQEEPCPEREDENDGSPVARATHGCRGCGRTGIKRVRGWKLHGRATRTEEGDCCAKRLATFGAVERHSGEAARLRSKRSARGVPRRDHEDRLVSDEEDSVARGDFCQRRPDHPGGRRLDDVGVR